MSRTFNKMFADRLGVDLGSYITSQVVNALFKELARACGLKYNIIPLMGLKQKRYLKALTAAYLQGVAVWTTREVVPEAKADPKILQKATNGMQQFVDQGYKAPIFDFLEEKEIMRYAFIRTELLRIAQKAHPTKEEFVQMFWEGLHRSIEIDEKNKRIKPNTVRIPELPEEKQKALIQAFDRSYELFVKLVNITISHEPTPRDEKIRDYTQPQRKPKKTFLQKILKK